MKLTELKRIVDLSMQSKYAGDSEVVVKVELPYVTVGTMPMVPIKGAQNGFDWESGRFILTPEENLTPSDRDFAKQMREMQDKLGWAEYENRGLKAEIRRLKKQLGEQNEQVD